MLIHRMYGLLVYVTVQANPWRTVPNLPVKGEILRSHLRLLEVRCDGLALIHADLVRKSIAISSSFRRLIIL